MMEPKPKTQYSTTRTYSPIEAADIMAPNQWEFFLSELAKVKAAGFGQVTIVFANHHVRLLQTQDSQDFPRPDVVQ